jgi:hypothetical protein
MRLRLALVLASALAFAPSVAHAQGADAKRAFEESVDVEKRGEYEAALERFRKIEAQRPTAGVLFHIGYCLENLNKLALAYEAYERAEKLARETNKPEVVTAVHARLDPLAKRVPLVNVTVEPKEAVIRIDGQAVTNMSVRVEPGDHDLVAEAPGYTSKKLRIQCPHGSVQSFALRLEPASANAAAATPGTATATTSPRTDPGSNASAPGTEPPPEQPSRGSIALPLAVTGGAVVLLAGGVVSFLLAGSAQSEARETCPTKPSCDDERSEVRTLDTVALTGFIAGAGLGALAVILWTGRSSGSAKVTASGSSLLLRGEF